MTTTPGRRSDADTYDLIDDALLELATTRAAWLGDPLTAIGLLADLIDQANRCLPQFVLEARDHGHSWQQIAQTLGTSPDETRLRFDPDSPIPDGRWPDDT